MFVTKIVVITIIVTFTGLNQVNSATLEDAQHAFTRLQRNTAEILSELALNGSKSIEEVNSYLKSENTKLKGEISDRIKAATTTIEHISENAEKTGLAVNTCQERAIADLSSFENNLLDRLNDCIGVNNWVSFNLHYQHWYELNLTANNAIKCTQRSLTQCSEYENKETCADSVLGYIEQAENRMISDAKKQGAGFINALIGYRLPCLDFILYELGLYPNYVINHLKTCINTYIKRDITSAC